MAADQSERIITVVLACREYPTGFFLPYRQRLGGPEARRAAAHAAFRSGNALAGPADLAVQLPVHRVRTLHHFLMRLKAAVNLNHVYHFRHRIHIGGLKIPLIDHGARLTRINFRRGGAFPQAIEIAAHLFQRGQIPDADKFKPAYLRPVRKYGFLRCSHGYSGFPRER